MVIDGGNQEGARLNRAFAIQLGSGGGGARVYRWVMECLRIELVPGV